MRFSSLSIFLAIGALLLLAGCGPTWVNSDLSPAEAKYRLPRDKAACEAQVNAQFPEEQPADVGEYAEAPESLSDEQFNVGLSSPPADPDPGASYDLEAERDKAMEACMRERGWRQSE